jgi:hypothetical protein
MENVTIVNYDNPQGNPIEHVIIDRGNGEFTSMPKSVWDEQQANQNNGGLN